MIEYAITYLVVGLIFWFRFLWEYYSSGEMDPNNFETYNKGLIFTGLGICLFLWPVLVAVHLIHAITRLVFFVFGAFK
jgi:hypothetical protein